MNLLPFSRRVFLRGGLLLSAALLTSLLGCKPADEAASNAVAPTGGAAQNPPPDGDELVLGHYASLTGGTATFGQSADRGIRMAIEEINSGDDLPLGKRLTVITEDNASRTEQVPAVVQKLINQNNVLVLLGEIASSRSLAAAPIAQNAGVPMVSPASTNRAVTQTGDFIFRTCFIDPFQGEVMARFGRENLNATTAAVLTDVANDYSKGLTEFFIRSWEERGGRIVARESYQEGDTDFQSQLTKIRSSNPDLIFVPGYYTEVGNIAVQARRLQIRQPLLGGDGWDSEQLFKIAQNELQGCYYSNHYSPESDNPKVQRFVTDYRTKYNAAPEGMAALGYDAAYIVADAIRRAGSADRAAIRDALAQTKDFEGVTGTISMDENRNAIKPAVVLKIEGDVGKYVTTVEP